MIKTSCRFCEFRENDENGVQTGCELNLLDRYSANGIAIETINIEDEHGKSEHKELDAFCIYRRPSGWKKAMTENADNAGKTFHEIARNEFKLEATLVVFVPPESTLEQVQDFISHIEQMSIKPVRVIFMNFAGISPLLFRQLKTKLDWSMEFVLRNQGPIDELRDRGNDLGSKKVKTPYFVQLDLSEKIRLDYLEIVNSKIVDDLDRFVVITNDIGKPSFYQTIVYRFVRGNEQASVNEKIQMLAEKQECPFLIKTTEELFQPQK